jgi:S-adenosylmethionine:diacylglycerol 3-amino-3-carboxypropyl transferase
VGHLADHAKTWEDPDVDVKKLGINKNDHVLAITSAGDNVLHYALAAQCERIHAVGELLDPASLRGDLIIQT